MPKVAHIGVLVVDDEQTDRNRIARALMAQGYEVWEATRYSDAMAVFDLNRNAITLLIADIALPDGNGCALAVAMRKQEPDLRVLLISFHVGIEVCKYYGITVPSLHLLRKPFDVTNLVRRVRKILRSAEAFPALDIQKTLTSSG